jgi:hypothetical protein
MDAQGLIQLHTASYPSLRPTRPHQRSLARLHPSLYLRHRYGSSFEKPNYLPSPLKASTSNPHMAQLRPCKLTMVSRWPTAPIWTPTLQLLYTPLQEWPKQHPGIRDLRSHCPEKVNLNLPLFSLRRLILLFLNTQNCILWLALYLMTPTRPRNRFPRPSSPTRERPL